MVDKPWDGPGCVAQMPNDGGAAMFRKMFTWVDGSADADMKGSYKLPHHEMNGQMPAAANVNGVRAALARLPQASGIPQADFDAIRAHLNKHLDKFNAGKKSSLDDLIVKQALVVEANTHVWAVREELLAVLSDLHGTVASDMMIELLAAKPDAGPSNVNKGVAVIPLQGVLMPNVGGLLGLLMGGGSVTQFRSQLASAAADPNVSSIVLDVDSPGGYVDQIPETAADIRSARAQKPVVAVANGMAASAAYWLASQAHEVVITPSGEAGSIGVYSVHMDQTDRYAQLGVKPTVVKAGKFKAEGLPVQPLTEEAQGAMQEAVDDYYDMFTADVAKGRGVSQQDVQDGFGEGRSLLAKRAVRAGVADKVATLGETVRRMQSGRARVRRTEDPNALTVLVEDDTPAEPPPVTYTQDDLVRLAAVKGAFG